MFGISEDLIKKELKVIPSTGFYKTEEEFIKEARYHLGELVRLPL